jgi:hypothetical protein
VKCLAKEKNASLIRKIVTLGMKWNTVSVIVEIKHHVPVKTLKE